MSDIRPISASSSNPDDVYRLLVMTHCMAGSLAIAKKDGWRLARTATFPSYVMTVWTNGIVDIGAETDKDYGGTPEHHRYWLNKAEQE
ncbi:hypothetical protein [Halomonas sp. RT37]|uniref:Uncharacterized protein n=1 Tax=Halomonas sp. RT37 TaxID=2950872 RepID=A0AAU7KD11_9GAMM